MEKNIELRTELVSSVLGLSDEQFNQKLAEDVWSIKQVCEHLILFDRVLLKRMNEALDQPDLQLEEKDISPSADRSRRVSPPESMKPTEDYAKRDDVLASLTASHQELVAFVNQLPNREVLQRRGIPHERYGSLSLAQWLELAIVHDRRHLSQIQDIKAIVRN